MRLATGHEELPWILRMHDNLPVNTCAVIISGPHGGDGQNGAESAMFLILRCLLLRPISMTMPIQGFSAMLSQCAAGPPLQSN